MLRIDQGPITAWGRGSSTKFNWNILAGSSANAFTVFSAVRIDDNPGGVRIVSGRVRLAITVCNKKSSKPAIWSVWR